MIEGFIVISIVGLVTGFIFSIPVAGPISILVTSRSLKGEWFYAMLAAVGASVVDFIYCFIAVFGFINLVKAYKPIIPIVLLAGSAFVIILGIKISRTKIDVDKIDETQIRVKKKGKKRSALITGFLLNLLNPTLFFGWLASSIVVMSFVAALGLDTIGFNKMLKKSSNEINNVHKNTTLDDSSVDDKKIIHSATETDKQQIKKSKNSRNHAKYQGFELGLSICYAFFLAIGTVVWFYFFARLISKHRKKLKMKTINRIIQFLGYALVCVGIFLIYKAAVFFSVLL